MDEMDALAIDAGGEVAAAEGALGGLGSDCRHRSCGWQPHQRMR
jgi:hypothetical protein